MSETKDLKTILVTGGSSGIGYEMSVIWAKKGYRVLWASLEKQEIEDAKERLELACEGVELHTLQIDLSAATASSELYEWSIKKAWRVDVVVNCAGFGTAGYLDSIDLEKEINMINLNVVNVYNITRLFLQDMRARNSGTIINISSITGFTPIPRMTTYAATKAFVSHFSRGLQQELKWQKSNVRVMTVYPAAIGDTKFKEGTANLKTFKGVLATNAKEVAKDIWNGFHQKKEFVITGRKHRWQRRLDFLVPRAVKLYMIKKETEIYE